LDIRNVGVATLGTLRMAIAARRLDTGGEPVALSVYHLTELLMLLNRLTTQARPDKRAELMREVERFLDEALPPGSAPDVGLVSPPRLSVTVPPGA
jgi:hypothetical protein